MGLLKAKAQRPLGPCVYLSTHPSRGHCPFPPSSSLRRRRAAEMAHRAPVAAAAGGGDGAPRTGCRMYPASADPASAATPATFQRVNDPIALELLSKSGERFHYIMNKKNLAAVLRNCIDWQVHITATQQAIA
uniref:Uncharacterized protein n=1 Tax=Oryza glumipatula TaxID=40148 RepID=A0A0D9YZT9_9ORYZ